MKLISVIIPIYNVQEYLVECIDSVVNQTYTNLEIILVNDGSPDNCGVICEEYALKDSRIKVIHKENGGLSDARNAGLDICTGEYIAFVDSDDSLHRDMYKILLNLICENDADIAECDIWKSNQDYDNIYPEKIVKKILIPSEWAENIIEHNKFSVWRRLYRKSSVEGVLFKKGFIYEDVFFFVDIFPNINKIAVINLPLYKYNNENLSITRSNFNIKKLQAIDAIIYQYEFFSSTLKLKNSKKLKYNFISSLIHYYTFLTINPNFDNDLFLRKKIEKKVEPMLSIINYKLFIKYYFAKYRT
jgi:glycosyltransferase involved in cell wall biosynthesis